MLISIEFIYNNLCRIKYKLAKVTENLYSRLILAKIARKLCFVFFFVDNTVSAIKRGNVFVRFNFVYYYRFSRYSVLKIVYSCCKHVTEFFIFSLSVWLKKKKIYILVYLLRETEISRRD